MFEELRTCIFAAEVYTSYVHFPVHPFSTILEKGLQEVKESLHHSVKFVVLFLMYADKSVFSPKACVVYNAGASPNQTPVSVMITSRPDSDLTK